MWRGWTTPANADGYETLLRTTIFPGILSRGIAGLHRLELLRRPLGAEVEFVTLLWFGTLDDVRAFAGEAYEMAVVLPSARALLARFEPAVAHYEIRETRQP
jgi:hypothetical protein